MKFNKGAVIDEPGSTEKNKTGGWRDKKPVIDKSKCTKCGICWVFCPEGAIYRNEKGEFEINYDYCKGCLICAEECPIKVISITEEEK
ncbi:MAG: pyruvate synthase subunit PorD [Candidatus Parvarchaeota archaeon]|nr:pyruvate synthase subunit PorD [Candidatus Jingweiarchaeum tengchongense]MCW1298006.1 pyruvate synthase subunit PorD [Candidatus Jingweiarchaeum tengchongense]MCW1300193.1 pyruvate synthase subunit PorD [Candidatus Jingweiarchaeum tengchongense]MCW1304403.1 pyruvate synthase subunit PorD [Candidatus Jingweiarchaeum tengchongense]MCW1305954.1 pyruvate synthase subunit PorD [Candidatus Jingweiarchaeum tengchongense]